jgi:hypothetical protein
MNKRPYSPLRRAYFPSVWPMSLIAVAIVVPLILFVIPRGNLPALLAVSVLVGAGVPSIRLKIWRWRHPAISPEQRIDDLRRQAPWN